MYKLPYCDITLIKSRTRLPWCNEQAYDDTYNAYTKNYSLFIDDSIFLIEIDSI